MPSDEVWALDVVDLVGGRASDADGEGNDAGLAAIIEERANAAVANDGIKHFLAIYALGHEGDMPEGIARDELALESFDAVAVVWSDRSVAFIKEGSHAGDTVVV